MLTHRITSRRERAEGGECKQEPGHELTVRLKVVEQIERVNGIPVNRQK